MADIPTRSVAQLPLASSVSTNDSTVIQQSGITKQVTLGTLGTVLSGAPNPKTLVIIGSSNAVGVGATSYSLSWAGLLTTALEAQGWTVRNVSVSGMNTATAISRFESTVAIYRPSHVIHCTALFNDGFDVETFIKNTETLITRTRQIGAVPIVRGASPLDGATTAQFRAMVECDRQLNQLGVWLIDALSTLVDWSSGGFVGTIYDTDGLHCSDAGYAAQYAAIDLGMFYYGPVGPGHYKPQGVWRVPTDVSVGDVMVLDTTTGLSKTLKSFTQRARIGGFSPELGAQAFFCHYTYGTGSAPSRVRSPTGVYDYITAAANTTAFTVSVGNFQTHDAVVVWRKEVSAAYFYIDGVQIGTVAIGAAQACSKFGWGSTTGSPSKGARYSDCQLWSVPLSPTQVADMYKTGYRPTGGLIFDGVFSETPLNGGVNLVQNGVGVTLGAPWVLFNPNESFASAAVSTDASGDVVINHGLQLPPSTIQVQIGGTTPRYATYHTVTSTSFTARVFSGAGTSVATSPVTLNWKAGYG
jgi:lysophospholipase L1-like esterase